MFLVSLLFGLIMLVLGAELLVRGGGQLALALRVPALVVGLTIVAFGTSAPELSVSIKAALDASPEMAMSNVTGSNIANIALVLGAAALVHPLAVDRTLIRRDVPSCIALQLAVLLLALDGTMSRVDGAILIAGGVLYNGWLFYEVFKGRTPPPDDEVEEEGGSWAQHVLMLLGGLGILVWGADLFVNGASEIARLLGMSDRYIGLTIVALGTSAPELATATLGAYKGEVELAVGNSLGSNILNIAMVLGLTILVSPINVEQAMQTDVAVAMLTTILLVPVVIRGRLSRVEGAAMIVGYLTYMGVGLLQA